MISIFLLYVGCSSGDDAVSVLQNYVGFTVVVRIVVCPVSSKKWNIVIPPPDFGSCKVTLGATPGIPARFGLLSGFSLLLTLVLVA